MVLVDRTLQNHTYLSILAYIIGGGIRTGGTLAKSPGDRERASSLAQMLIFPLIQRNTSCASLWKWNPIGLSNVPPVPTTANALSVSLPVTRRRIVEFEVGIVHNSPV